MAPADLQLVSSRPADPPAWSAPRVAVPAIQTHADYVALSEDLKLTKSFLATVEAFFKPLKQAADTAKKALLDAEREKRQPALAYEADVKAALLAWDTAQERIRRQQERELQEAERKREEQRRLEMAAALESAGATAEAEAVLDEALTAPAPVVSIEKATPKVEGISYRENWSATVTDPMKLIRFVANHPQFEHLLTPNQVALNGLARSLKGALQIDGVQATPTRVVAASGR